MYLKIYLLRRKSQQMCSMWKLKAIVTYFENFDKPFKSMFRMIKGTRAKLKVRSVGNSITLSAYMDPLLSIAVMQWRLVPIFW